MLRKMSIISASLILREDNACLGCLSQLIGWLTNSTRGIAVEPIKTGGVVKSNSAELAGLNIAGPFLI